jgi:hypothetical protein
MMCVGTLNAIEIPITAMMGNVAVRLALWLIAPFLFQSSIIGPNV